LLVYSEQLEQKITKPDVDNLAKAILDALNGVAYEDDSQVYSLEVQKWYVGVGGTVGTWIKVQE
jgi:Holliday junction resolvase RusA-like endonuclease